MGSSLEADTQNIVRESLASFYEQLDVFVDLVSDAGHQLEELGLVSDAGHETEEQSPQDLTHDEYWSDDIHPIWNPGDRPSRQAFRKQVESILLDSPKASDMYANAQPLLAPSFSFNTAELTKRGVILYVPGCRHTRRLQAAVEIAQGQYVNALVFSGGKGEAETAIELFRPVRKEHKFLKCIACNTALDTNDNILEFVSANADLILGREDFGARPDWGIIGEGPQVRYPLWEEYLRGATHLLVTDDYHVGRTLLLQRLAFRFANLGEVTPLSIPGMGNIDANGSGAVSREVYIHYAVEGFFSWMFDLSEVLSDTGEIKPTSDILTDFVQKRVMNDKRLGDMVRAGSTDRNTFLFSSARSAVNHSRVKKFWHTQTSPA